MMLNNVGQSDASSCVSALPGGAPNLIPLATSGSSTTIPGGSCVVMEVLQSEDLLRIPLVRKMIQEHLRLLDMQLSWRMECFRLRDENAQLRGHSHPSNISPMLTPSATPSRVVEGLSETPSRDELIRLYHQRSAASRPAKFPQSILWDFKDVRCDPNIKQSSWNPSRPPMHQALRNEDGSPLPKAEYERIRVTARALRAELFTLPSLADDHEKDTRRPMSYFKTHHSDEWKCAVVKIELKHPVTGWCSAHWKSEHMLALVLRSKSKKDRAADPEGSVAEASRSNSPPLAITAQTESVHESSSNVSLTSPTIPPLLNITTPELSGTIIPSLNDLILSFAATSSRLDAIALDGSSAIPGEENAEEIADGARGPSKRPHSTTSKPTKRRRLISSPQKTAGSYYSQDLARRG